MVTGTRDILLCAFIRKCVAGLMCCMNQNNTSQMYLCVCVCDKFLLPRQHWAAVYYKEWTWAWQASLPNALCVSCCSCAKRGQRHTGIQKRQLCITNHRANYFSAFKNIKVRLSMFTVVSYNKNIQLQSLKTQQMLKKSGISQHFYYQRSDIFIAHPSESGWGHIPVSAVSLSWQTPGTVHSERAGCLHQ